MQRVLSEPIKFGNYELPRFGLEDLVEKTYQVLPQGIRRAFNNAQKVDIKRKQMNPQMGTWIYSNFIWGWLHTNSIFRCSNINSRTSSYVGPYNYNFWS